MPQYNQDGFVELIRGPMPWASSIDWSCVKYNDWLNYLLKIIDK